MRRPLALIGFTLFGCSFAYIMLGDTAAWIALPLFGAAAVVLLFLRRRFRNRHHWAWCQCFTVAVTCSLLLLCLTTAFVVTPLASVENTTKTLTMTVVEQDGLYDTAHYYVVDATGVYEDGSSLRLRLRTDGQKTYVPGQVLQGQVYLKPISQAGRAKQYANRIWLNGTVSYDTTLTEAGVEKTVYYYCYSARQTMKTWFNQNLSGDSAALVSGVCLGDTEGLSNQTYEDFTRCGMGHMVAVSGLHTSTLSGLLVGLFVILRTKKRYAKVLSLLMVWSFIFMVGMPFSAVRAGIMFTFWAVLSLFYRVPDGLNTLGAAALLILLFHPFATGDIGFLASFLSCLGILWFAAPVTDALLRLLPLSWRNGKFFVWLFGGVGVTLSVLFTTLPCSLLRFYTVSLVSPIANLLGIPLASVVLLTGLLSGVLSLVPGLESVALWILKLGGACADGLVELSHTLGDLPYASVQFATVWCWIAFLAAVVAVALVYCLRRRIPGWGKTAVAGLLAIVVVGASFVPNYSSRQYEVMAVGDGYDTALVVASAHGTAVIGCAKPSEIKRLLYERGIHRVDCWFLPREVQYEENVLQLAQQLDIGQIYTKSAVVKKGDLLPPAERYDQVVLQQQRQLGDMTITANPSFTRFELVLGEQTLVFEHTKTKTNRPIKGTYVIYHASIDRSKGYEIRQNDQTETYTKTMVLQWNTPNAAWREPIFLY